MPEIPEAKQVTLKGSRQNPAFPRDPERRIEHTYTRRTGICPKPGHKGRTSTSFMGVNEHGWLFHCSYVDDAGHAFVNRPPLP